MTSPNASSIRILRRQCSSDLLVTVGPHAVKTGQKIYFDDPSLALAPVGKDRQRRVPEVSLRLYLDYVDPMLQLQGLGTQDIITETMVVAATAFFGGDPTASRPPSGEPVLRFGHGEGVRVVRFPNNPLGCAPYDDVLLENEAIAVRRGDCTFLEKLVFAQRAGASGVVVLGDEDHHINPSADSEEVLAAGEQINEVAVVVLRREDAELVAKMLDAADKHGLGAVRLVVEPSDGPSEPRNKNDGRHQENVDDGRKEVTRVLYLNNHPLLNTRLNV